MKGGEKMIITAKQLDKAGACDEGVERFRAVFGESAKVTEEHMYKMFDHTQFGYVGVIENLMSDLWGMKIDPIFTEAELDNFDKATGSGSYTNALILLDIVAGMED